MATKKKITATKKKSKGAFANMLGGHYRLDALADCFIPGIDGDPEFPLKQTWRPLEVIDESDVESVIRNGVIQAITVRKRSDGRAEVEDGRQRVRWVRLANERLALKGLPLIDVPARVSDPRSTDVGIFGRTMETNYHRIAPSPMQQSEDAVQMLRLMGENDLESVATSSLKEVASRMRCSVDKVRNLIKLDQLAPEVQKLVGNRELQMQPALNLLGYEEVTQVAKARDLVAARQAGASSSELVEKLRTERDTEAEADRGLDHDGDFVDATNDAEVIEGTGLTAEPAARAEREPSKELRKGQIKGLLRLIELDRTAKAGAGVDIPDAVVSFLKIQLGKKGPAGLKGLTELLNRLAKGE